MVKFDISKNELYSAGGKEIADALKDNQVMAELNLAGNKLGWRANSGGKSDMSGLIAISSAIPTMRAMTTLNITDNYIPSDQRSAIKRICDSKSIALSL